MFTKMPSCFKVTYSIFFLNVLYLVLPLLLLQMARNKLTARKSTCGPLHPIHRSQEVSDPEDNHDYYYDSKGGWVDTDTKEEPMELPEDHPEVSSGSNEGPVGGDGGDSGAADGDKGEGGDDDSGAPGDDDDDPDDDPEPAVATNSPPPPEPHYEKQILHLESAEGPFRALLWRAMQRIGFPRKPHYEAHLFRNAQQEEEWLVLMLICVPDERPGCWVEYSKHIDEVPRRTLEAGTSEAARRALYFLC
jgi:hypothetical protein